MSRRGLPQKLTPEELQRALIRAGFPHSPVVRARRRRGRIELLLVPNPQVVVVPEEDAPTPAGEAPAADAQPPGAPQPLPLFPPQEPAEGTHPSQGEEGGAATPPSRRRKEHSHG